MDTFETVEQRRAVKHYDPEHRLTADEEQRLFSLALLSPTSFNIQNWRFVHVVDAETRRQIREAAWGQAQVTEASMLLVLCGDLLSWNREPTRYWRNAPENVRDTLVPMIVDFYQGKEQLQRDEVMRSAGIAAQTIMLCAKAMGYDSCPMIGFDADAVARIINLPADHVVGMMLAVGKAIQPARARGGSLPMDEVVIRDRFE